jgi:hypothetical protein
MPDVFEDAALFGTYAQLLIYADTAYPSLAEVPRLVDERLFAVLVEMGEVVPGDAPYTYSVVRLDVDRNERSDQAAEAVRHRKTNPVKRPKTKRPIIVRSSTDDLQTNGTERDVTKNARDGASVLDGAPRALKEDIRSFSEKLGTVSILDEAKA